MRKVLAPALLVLTLAAGSGAMAATAPAKPAPAAAAAHKQKVADCVKQWNGQKSHSQTRKAFLAACEKA